MIILIYKIEVFSEDVLCQQCFDSCENFNIDIGQVLSIYKAELYIKWISNCEKNYFAIQIMFWKKYQKKQINC